MKSLTRTIILLVIINLTIGNFALAQNAPEGKLSTYTISCSAGVRGVEMQGLPGMVVTDSRGYYSATVERGWSGRVMPVRGGYNFEPACIIYRKITNNRDNQDYVSKMITFIISGRTGVVIDNKTVTGLSGAVMEGLPGNPVTDENGFYSATVKYGWRGTVTPVKKGYTFAPPSRNYNNITENLYKCFTAIRTGPAPVFGRNVGRKVLVIPATDFEAEDLTAITEDLQVMSHIFDERFKEPWEIKGVFVDFGDFFGRDSRSTEAIYIQGYGALFLMEVNFTFSPEPEPQEQEAQETEEYIDPDWQRAKQQLFYPQGFGGGTFVPEEQYSADKIDQIKTELIRTLKHAANIRNLQPDEWVILTVIGQSRQPGGMYEDYYRIAAPRTLTTSRRPGRSSSSSRGGYGGGMMGGMASGDYGGGGSIGGGVGGIDSRRMGGQAFGDGVMMGGGMGGMMGGMEYGETGSASTTVLTIRAKKADVDAFAIGELDFEKFQEKVEIFTY